MNRFIPRWVSAMWCCLAALTMSACNDKQQFPINEPPPSAEVEIESLSLSVSGTSDVPVGLNGYVSATATYSDGETRNVTPQVRWSLDNESFIQNGLTDDGEQRFEASEGKSGTKTEISATFDGVKSDNTITLSVSSAIVQALKVTPTYASSPAGLSQQFYASAVLSDSRVLDVTSEESVSWQVGEQDVENGLVVATENQVGETLIVSASGSIGAEAFLSEASLEVSDLVVKGLIVEPADGQVWNSDLAVQDSRPLVEKAILSNNTVTLLHHSDVRWSTSDNSTYVTVNVCGDEMCATGLASGQESVVTSLDNFTDDFIFNVFEFDDAQGQVVSTEEQLRKGDAIHLKFFAKNKDGNFTDLSSSLNTTWALSETEYAHMQGNKLIATPPGGYDSELEYPASQRVTVTATNETLSGTYDVELIDAQVMSLVISPSTDTEVAFGHNLQLEAFITYSDGIQKNVTSSSEMNWSTSNASVAYFDNTQKGLLVTAAPEFLTVTGKFNGLTQTSSMDVTVNAQQPRELALSPTVGYRVGQPQPLTLTLTYDDGSVQKLAIDDESVSVVVTGWDGAEDTQPSVSDDGVVYATTPGTAKLTATKAFNSKSSVSVVEDIEIKEAALISTLAVSPKEATLAFGQSHLIEAYALDTNGQVIELSPSELDYSLPDDITGSLIEPDTGVFYAGNAPGTVSLTVAMKNPELAGVVNGQVPTQIVPIEVVDKELQAIEVLLPEGLELIPGQKVALSALGRYTDGTIQELSNDTITWSQTGSVILLDEYTLTATQPGDGSLTATYNSNSLITDSKTIKVNNASVTSLRISPDITELPVGFTQIFEAFAVADTGDSVRLAPSQVTFVVSKGHSNVTTEFDIDGNFTVTAVNAGSSVTVRADLQNSAFPNVNNTDTYAEASFTTVEADITNLVVEPLHDSTVLINVPYNLRAVAVQDNGESFDATYKVSWTSNDTNVRIDDTMKTVMFLQDAKDTVELIATPNDAIFGDYTARATSTVTVLKPEAVGIMLSEEEVMMGTGSFQLKAYEYYSYGLPPVDVTKTVTWSVVPKKGSSNTFGITIRDGLISSSTLGGEVEILAQNATGSKAISLGVFGMCGTGVDDTDMKNANSSSYCIKVATDMLGFQFTSTPVERASVVLGFSGGTKQEFGNGPNGWFSIYSSKGEDSLDGNLGSYDQLCKKLASLNFAGRSDWERTSLSQLQRLFNTYKDNGGLKEARGWPVIASTYRASDYTPGNTPGTGTYRALHLGDGSTERDPIDRSQVYASCVSSN